MHVFFYRTNILLFLVRLESAAASVRDELGVQEAVRLHVHREGGVDRQEPQQGETYPGPHVELELGDLHQGYVCLDSGVVVGCKKKKEKIQNYERAR